MKDTTKEKNDILTTLGNIFIEAENQDKFLKDNNSGWRKELRERFAWTQQTTVKGKYELEKFIESLLEQAREEVAENIKDKLILEVLINSEEPYSTDYNYIEAYNDGIEKAIDIINKKLSNLTK